VLADPAVDSVIVLFVPPATAGAEDVAAGLARTLEAVSTDKPVLAALLSAEGIPAALRKTPAPAALFTYPESAARALGLAAQRAEWLRRPAGTVPEVEGIDTAAAERIVANALGAADDIWLTPAETRELLTAYGLPLVEERLAESTEDAVEAARKLGFPVVVKSAVAGAHKTETGGVALDVGHEAAVREAAERIGPPVLVQTMVEGGTELLAGIVQDPTFGPLVAFGPGGVLAELIGEAGFRIAPLTDVDAEELLQQEKTGLLVAGYRGAPPADTAALADLIHRLSRLGEDLPEVAELDLNPVLAGPEGCVAVDARARVRRPTGGARVKTW
jgi:acyl-CoA synthetase (NDP forming)